MMSHDYQTLQAIFRFDAKELKVERLSAADATEQLSKLRDTMHAAARKVEWPLIRDSLMSKINELLDIRLLDVLIGAWKKVAEIRDCLNRSTMSSDDVFLVSLAEHTISSVHHPHLEILANGVSMGKIDFTVAVKFSLEGIVLKISSGQIRAIEAGSCKAGGSIELEGLVLLEKETKPLAIPGSLELNAGAIA